MYRYYPTLSNIETKYICKLTDLTVAGPNIPFHELATKLKNRNIEGNIYVGVDFSSSNSDTNYYTFYDGKSGQVKEN